MDLERHLDDPERLEQAYREDPRAFTAALSGLQASFADHVLVRAWRARLFAAPATEQAPRSSVEWSRVVALAICAGVAARLLFLGSSDNAAERLGRFGAFVVLVPIGWLLWKSRPRALRRSDVAVCLAALLALPFAAFTPLQSSHSGILSLAHLPLFLITLVFATFAGGPSGTVAARAEFVAITGEVAILTLALLFGGALLTGLTVRVFSLIELDVADLYFKNVVVGCTAAAPIIATGLERARAQRNERLGPGLARVFSPLVLATLVAYLIAIIGTQHNPYKDRESLAILCAMLLATAVLVTLMIVKSGEAGLSRRVALLACAICGLASAVDAIALSAIIYRFASFGLSPNRVAVLGGNLLLFAYLSGLAVALAGAARSDGDGHRPLRWIGGFIPFFGAWSALWVFVLPALFRFR